MNIVAEVADLLNTYTIDMSHSEDLKQVHQILQALIEMCVGNFENQHVIFKQVVEPINRILQLPYESYHDEYYQYYDNDEHKLTEVSVITMYNIIKDLIVFTLRNHVFTNRKF